MVAVSPAVVPRGLAATESSFSTPGVVFQTLGPAVSGFVVVLALWGVLALHEFGHYLTGRRIVEIPSTELRLVSPLLPRYVALRDDGEWIAPTEFEGYRQAYERHDPELEHLERFVAGGDLIQAAVVIPVALVLGLAGVPTIAGSVLVVSLVTTYVSVGYDALVTRQTGSPSGDYSALWQYSRRVPILILIGFTFVHLGAFYFV